jgi:hypothetical protein
MSEDYAALWRASAYEAVPYTDDFPECFLTLPEIFDGSIGQGAATEIITSIEILNDRTAWIRVRDNGSGLKNMMRFLKWAARKSDDNFHRNGHGMKKCMTKFEKDYSEAEWMVTFRNSLSKLLARFASPFKGLETATPTIEDDGTLMPNGGTEWAMKFNPVILSSLLKNSSEPATKQIGDALKELIQTRYSEEFLERIHFIIKVSDMRSSPTAPPYILDSRAADTIWHSFQWYVEREVLAERAVVTRDMVVDIPGAQWHYKGYKINVDGRENYPLKMLFPRYGYKNMTCSRVHISLNGRVIEAIPYYKMVGSDANHNNYNGKIEFVNFIPNVENDIDNMPIPCTTKVSFYENDEIFKEFKRHFQNIQREVPLNRVGGAVSVTRSVSPSQTQVRAQSIASIGSSSSSSLTEEESDTEIESNGEEIAAPEPVDILNSWGITLKNNGLHHEISIKIHGEREKIVINTIYADYISIRRRILRCRSADEAKKKLKAWIRIMQ